MNLSDPGTLKTFLGKFGVKADKSLGQHFLVSSSVVHAIVDAASGFSGVLEIGPGPGVLTTLLSSPNRKVIAIELDPRMVNALKVSAPDAEVRKEDALKVDLSAIFEALPRPRALVSNLPYYITGPLLNRFAEVASCFERAVLMMQREVAERISAKPGASARGSISVYLQARFEIETLLQVPPEAFLPPPKVASTVLILTPKPDFAEMEEAFFKFVRLGFSQPRKTIVNNLVAGLKLTRDQAVECLEAVGLPEKARPHDLSQESWEALWRHLTQLPKP